MNGPGDRILLVHPHHLHSATIVRRGDNGTIIAQDEAGAEWQAEAIPAYHILSSSPRLSSPSLGQPPPEPTTEHATSAIEGFKAQAPSEPMAATACFNCVWGCGSSNPVHSCFPEAYETADEQKSCPVKLIPQPDIHTLLKLMREETSSDSNSPSTKQPPAKAKRAGKTKHQRDMPGN